MMDKSNGLVKYAPLESLSEANIPGMVEFLNKRSMEHHNDFLGDALISCFIIGADSKNYFFSNRIVVMRQKDNLNLANLANMPNGTIYSSKEDIYTIKANVGILGTNAYLWNPRKVSFIRLSNPEDLIINKQALIYHDEHLYFGYVLRKNLNFITISNHHPNYSKKWFKNKSYDILLNQINSGIFIK